MWKAGWLSRDETNEKIPNDTANALDEAVEIREVGEYKNTASQTMGKDETTEVAEVGASNGDDVVISEEDEEMIKKIRQNR